VNRDKRRQLTDFERYKVLRLKKQVSKNLGFGRIFGIFGSVEIQPPRRISQAFSFTHKQFSSTLLLTFFTQVSHEYKRALAKVKASA